MNKKSKVLKSVTALALCAALCVPATSASAAIFSKGNDETSTSGTSKLNAAICVNGEEALGFHSVTSGTTSGSLADAFADYTTVKNVSLFKDVTSLNQISFVVKGNAIGSVLVK